MKTDPLTIIVVLILLSPCLEAQQRVTLNDALGSALQNNQQYRINASEIQKAALDVKTANEIPKTGVFAENEDMRPSDKQGILKIGLSQSISWPGLYRARKEYFNEHLKYYQLNTSALNAVIRRDVRSAYYELWYLQDKFKLFQQLDSIYSSLFKAAELRVKTGEAAGLDRIAAEARMREVRARLEQNSKEMLAQQQRLAMLLNATNFILPLDSPLEKIVTNIVPGDSLHPSLQLMQQNISIANSNIAVQKNLNRPEFSGRFFSQKLYGASDPFSGFSLTASFPLFGLSAYKNKVKAAEAEQQLQQRQLEYQQQVFNAEQQQILAGIQKSQAMLQFYETIGLTQSEEIIKAATLSYTAGEISFAELSQFLGQAIGTRQGYLDALNEYNQSVIQFNFYANK